MSAGFAINLTLRNWIALGTGSEGIRFDSATVRPMPQIAHFPFNCGSCRKSLE